MNSLRQTVSTIDRQRSRRPNETSQCQDHKIHVLHFHTRALIAEIATRDVTRSNFGSEGSPNTFPGPTCSLKVLWLQTLNEIVQDDIWEHILMTLDLLSDLVKDA